MKAMVCQTRAEGRLVAAPALYPIAGGVVRESVNGRCMLTLYSERYLAKLPNNSCRSFQ